MILNINFNDNDHSINLLGDAIFQFLELFQSKCTPYFLQNVARYIFLIIKRNERVPYEFKEQNVFESKAEIGSAIIYCKRDCCSKFKFFLHIHYFVFISAAILLDLSCYSNSQFASFVIHKLITRPLNYMNLQNYLMYLVNCASAIKYTCSEKFQQGLGTLFVATGKYFSKDTTELMIEYLRFRVYPIQYFCFDIVVSVCYSGS